MHAIDSCTLLRGKQPLPGLRYLFDTLLALVGTMGVTGIIFAYHLYPRIPNISIIYLLVVLPLAVTRGRYSAMLASVLAFLSFDFFIVPPLYTFVMYHIEEWIALFIFLIDALLTGQLAAALRQRAEGSARRERETRALYHLARATNRVEDADAQLHAISRAVVATFSSWGVQDCAILQPDANGVLQVQVSASQSTGDVPLWQDQPASVSGSRQRMLRTVFAWIAPAFPITRPVEKRTPDHSLHLVPLKRGQKVVGALRLEVLGDPDALLKEEQRVPEEKPSAVSASFFWTFVDQATALIERARLQRENLHLEILKRTDALRAALLSSVSHDLRTPLTSIKAAASSLLQEDVEWKEETRRDFLHAIEREADRLNRLVANLLDMSRIEEGALKPDKDWYSLKALIQDVRGRLAPVLEARPVLLHLPADLLMVELDYLHIDQVLTNLLENALRYTPATSPIEISAQCEHEQMVLSVADRGPGIPPADLERVFDKFYRVMHASVSATTPVGSGLGLAVCKGLIEAHGGRIWAELRAEGGLVVYATLPLKEQERIVS